LISFGDASADVRESAQDASQVIMANMPGHGIELILPSLLLGLNGKKMAHHN
jgi:hypothetical protein